MKRFIILSVIVLTTVFSGNAQTRGVKIGYIDMEYILQNVPEYTEAKNQLEQKAQRWKQEVEVKKNAITLMKDALKTERVLLTKELLQEREDEIAFQETELLDYQQKRFGPTGDLIMQKTVLTQPIQDQVFTAVQDIAEAKKYDFIFDKTSDFTMLFSNKRYDISDQVVRALTRANKRGQKSKKELKEEDAQQAKEDMIDESPALQDRQKKLDDRRAAREKLVADRKAAAEEKRRKQIEAREAKKNGTVPASDVAEPSKTDSTATDKGGDEKTTSPVADLKAEKAAERAAKLEERKQALEAKRLKTLADREAAKKAKENKGSDTTPGN